MNRSVPLARGASLAILVCITGLPTSLFAQAETGLPLWELGVVTAGFSQQAYPGSSQMVDRALVLPSFRYRGEYLRADNGNVGIRAVKTEGFEIDVGFSGAFGSSSGEIDARRGMPNLGTLVEFGPRVKWSLGPGPSNGRLRAELSLRGVFDLNDQLAGKGASLEPELIYERRTPSGLRYGITAGWVFGDQRLNDTFYGVAPQFATALRPAYAAQGGLIMSRLSLNLVRGITPNLQVFALGRLFSVGGGANQSSPLVLQKTGSSVGVGLVYTFARSSETVDTPSAPVLAR